MPDASGTPSTNFSIPKYATGADAPSGKGFNTAIDFIDTLLLSHVSKPLGIVSGEVPVWNGSGWDRSTVTKIGASSISPIGGTSIVSLVRSSNDGPTGITTTGDGDPLFSFPTATFEAVPYYFEMFVYSLSTAGNEQLFYRLHDGVGAGQPLVQEGGVRTPVTNPGNPMFLRFGFTPSAGSHTYAVRWRGGSGTYTNTNSTTPMVVRIVKV